MATVKKTTTRKKATTSKKRVPLEVDPERQAAIDMGLTSPKGRRSGSQHKVPLKIRETLAEYLGDEIPYLMSRRGELELKDRWDIVKSILPFCTPKMISNDINADMNVNSVGDSLSQLASESAAIVIGTKAN